MSKRFPGRRLSWFRVTILALVVALVGAAGYWGVQTAQDQRTAAAFEPWFAGYVDVTATPRYEFQSSTEDALRNVVLGFIVAADSRCEASWGNYYDLSDSGGALDLDRRIARVQERGGEVIPSFGGEHNLSLAGVCPTAEALAAQYRAVLKRYDTPIIDLDIEGEDLEDDRARQRRVDAIALLQEDYADQGDELIVWLTLPVSLSGLTDSGVTAVSEFLEAGVRLAGVNAMTMNYGAGREGLSLAAAARSSLDGLHRQLSALYADHGTPLGSQTIWRMIGATPMIGQNVTRGDVFTLDDARELQAFAAQRGVGRMSMWSLNRDQTCALGYPDWTVVSESCSGVDQGAENFWEILSDGFDATPVTVPDATPTTPGELVDDPATSPYPIWNAEASYPADTRVVWRRNVYIAQWWTEGEQPDNPRLPGRDNPWQLIGPVLPGETPPPELVVPDDLFPAWDPGLVYHRGDRVLHDGRAYEAKWWTQSDSPDQSLENPGDSPWRALTRQELEALL